jgi:HPt (histidine-containing phosphotransfer) domain-containing protein
LTNASAKRRPSLLERISGPKAAPLSTLVKKGEAAAMRVQEGFGDFLGQRIRELTDARQRLADAPSSAWEQFYAVVVDLRGSAAMAGQNHLCAVCHSLEMLIREHVRDSRAAAVAGSHIDALLLLSSGRQKEGQKDGLGRSESAEHLIGELKQAVARLPQATAS